MKQVCQSSFQHQTSNMVSEEFRVHLTSDASLDLFPDNNPTHFRVKIATPLKLDPKLKWSVALVSANWPEIRGAKVQSVIYLCSDICSPAAVNNTLQPVLSQMYKRDLATFWSNPLRYIPLSTHELSCIDLFIIQADGDPISFKRGRFCCELHFKPI